MPERLVSASLLAAILAVPAAAETNMLPDLGRAAALAFKETCLATRGQGKDAAIAAILARPGVAEGPSLPAFGRGEPMRVFDEGSISYLVRSDKKGRYGCFVAISANSQVVGAVKETIDSFEGVQARPSKPAKANMVAVQSWSFAGSKDEIRLAPSSSTGSVLINLEVKR